MNIDFVGVYEVKFTALPRPSKLRKWKWFGVCSHPSLLIGGILIAHCGICFAKFLLFRIHVLSPCVVNCAASERRGILEWNERWIETPLPLVVVVLFCTGTMCLKGTKQNNFPEGNTLCISLLSLSVLTATVTPINSLLSHPFTPIDFHYALSRMFHKQHNFPEGNCPPPPFLIAPVMPVTPVSSILLP